MDSPFAGYSDEELQAIAEGKSLPSRGAEAYSDDELKAIAGLEPSPAKRNPVTDLVKGLYEGFARRIPEQIGQTMQFTGIAPEAGKRLADWATEGESQEEKGAFREAGEMIPSSAGIPMALAGAGKLVSLIPHPLAKAVGIGLQLLPVGLTPMMFGASQAQQTLDVGNERLKTLEDQAKAATDPDQKAALETEAATLKENLKTAPWMTGGIEALGETLGTLAFERALGPFAPAVPIMKQGAKQIAKGTLGAWLKEMAFVTMPTELGTEVGQGLGEAAVEKEMGIRPDANPLAEGLGAIPPTLIMTALMGGAGKAFSNHHANRYTKTLTSPEADPKARAEAADNISRLIRENEENTKIADAWDSYAKSRISSGLDIPLDTPMDELGLRIEGMEEQLKGGLGIGDDVVGEDTRTKTVIADRVAEERRKALLEEGQNKPEREPAAPLNPLEGGEATLTPQHTQSVPETTSVDDILTGETDQPKAPTVPEQTIETAPPVSPTIKTPAAFLGLQETPNNGKPLPLVDVVMPNGLHTQATFNPEIHDLTNPEAYKTAIDKAAHEAATSPINDLPEPTEAQKKAGVYKMGHIQLHGMDISIENPKGSTRSGTAENGKEWQTTMQAHYGYIKRTEGKDGDHVDVFIGEHPESDQVFVVDQVNPKTGKFDEHKVMLGYNDLESAWKGYHDNYEKGWTGAKNIEYMTMDQFKTWLKEGDTTKPANSQKTGRNFPENFPAIVRDDSRYADENLHDLIEGAKGEQIARWRNITALRNAITEGKGTAKQIARMKDEVAHLEHIYEGTYVEMNSAGADAEVIRNEVETKRTKEVIPNEGKQKEGKGETEASTKAQEQEVTRKPKITLRDRIAAMYETVAPGRGLEDLSANLDHIQKAIETGVFNDLMHPMNKASRKVFSRLTGIPLPKSLKATEALFTGKPFSLRKTAEKPANNISKKSSASSQQPATITKQSESASMLDLSKKSNTELVADMFAIIKEHLGERGSFSNELTEPLYEKLKPYFLEFVTRAKAKAAETIKEIRMYVLGAIDNIPAGKERDLWETAAERYVKEMEGPRSIDNAETGEPFEQELWRSPNVGGKINEPGAFYALTEEGAARYSRGPGINVSLTDKIRLENPLVAYSKEDAISELGATDEYRKLPQPTDRDPDYYIDILVKDKAEAAGYDGVIYKSNSQDDVEVQVFNPPKLEEGTLPKSSVQGKQQLSNEAAKPEEEKPTEQVKTDNAVLGEKLSKLRDEIDRKGSGFVDGMTFSIQQRENARGTAYGYFWQKVVDGARVQKGPGGHDTWSRDKAIDKLMEEARWDIEAHAKEKQIAQPEKSGTLIEGGKTNEPSANGSAGQGPLEAGKPEGLSENGQKERPDSVQRGSGQADNERDADVDESGTLRTGGLAGEPTPIHLQDGGSPGEGLSTGSVDDNSAPASEPRTIKLSGINPGNYRISEEDDIGSGTRGQKIDGNLAAIRLVKQLDQEKRYPTKEEQAVLAKYVGWGGLKNVFDTESTKPQDRKAREELESLLTKEEYLEAFVSIRNAHYTSPQVVQSIYKIMRHFGFTGGNVLEPTYGVGNFIGLMPDDLTASSKWYGSEMDIVTAKIGQYLYPDSQLIQSPFQRAEFPYGKFDVAIGNPPFGDDRVADTRKTRAEINRMKIHNYVVSKSGLHLKPGGIMGMVITNRFLDTADPEARDFLAKQFRFLGAIRLPNDAFAKNAGTEVTTDLVFLQRLMPDEKADLKATWLETGATMTNRDGEEITLNRYFADNPDLMLGEPSMKGTMYGGHWKEGGKGEFTLNKREGQPETGELIDKILETHFADLKDVMRERANDKLDAEALSLVPNKEDVGIGGFFMDSDRVYMRGDNDEYDNPTYTQLTPHTLWSTSLTPDENGGYTHVATKDGKKITVHYQNASEIPERLKLGKTRLSRIKGMLKLRVKAYELVTAERFDLSNIEGLRKELNKLYDGFVAEHGFLSEPANFSLMADDVKIEFGLEMGFKKEITRARAKTLGIEPAPASAEKATILKERMFFPEKEILYAKDALDGYNISLSQKGKLDLDYVASLTGQPREEVIKDLADQGMIYQDPESDEWIQEDEYLSGNVKAKHKLAEGKEGFEKNAEALKNVFPPDVATDGIFANPGASWIPTKVYEQFGAFIGLQDAHASIYNTGQFNMRAAGTIQNEINIEWKNDYFTLDQIFNAVSNNKVLIAYDGSGDDRVQNKEQTKILATIVKSMRSTFFDWIFADETRARELTKIYNDTQNTHAERKHAGEHMKTVGASPAVILRNTQRNAAWRMIQASHVLLDHCVGAGKTFTIITGVQERVRMGLTNKAMIVVPNHLVGQWAADYMKLYPGARILAATKKDFQKANRRRLFARIATGKYDAVITGHSSFGFIPIERETVKNLIMEEIAHLERAHNQAKADGNKRLIRTLANRIQKKREKIAELLNKPKDDVTSFEAMGVDHLVVDESHEFKNLEYSSGMQNITGMGNPMGSHRAFDLYSKIRWLSSQKDHALTFATGTPISNSLVEMYALLRYMNRQALIDRGIDAFDAWANNYASVETRVEYTSSQRLKERTIMATFNNMPELLQLYKEFADTVTMEDLKRIYAEQIREQNAKTGGHEREEFPIPKVKDGGRVLDAADATPRQIEYVDYLVARAERLEEEGGKNDPRIDNHLWLMGDARKMALDIRLVDPTAGDSPNNKVNRASKRIKEIYDRTEADKGAQLVFCDLSTPSKAARKNADGFIKAALKKARLNDDAAVKAILSALSSYQEKWGYIRNRLEDEVDAITNHPLAETEQYMKRREEIDEFLQATTDDVVADLTTADTGFSVYDEMRSKLVDMGIPEGEIRFIHEANTDPQKQEMFDLVNAGKVRILFGSSQKMGAGMNVQERLVAEHHMDAPWRPSDVEQREGRIIRQGNSLYERDPDGFEVEVIAYSTKNTFDAVMWQILTRKGAMLDDFRSGSRSVEDSSTDSASYSDFMAETTGNPAFKKKFRLENEIEILEALRSKTQTRLRSAKQSLEYNKGERERRQQSAEKREGTAEKLNGQATFTYGGEEFRGDVDALMDAERESFRQYNLKVNKGYNDEIDAAIEAAFKKEKLKAPEKPVTPGYDVAANSKEWDDYKEARVHYDAFWGGKKVKRIVEEVTKGIKKPQNRHFHAEKFAKEEKSGSVAACLKLFNEVNDMSAGERASFHIGPVEIAIEKNEYGSTTNNNGEAETRYDYVVTADGSFVHRFTNQGSFYEHQASSIINADYISVKVQGNTANDKLAVRMMDESDTVSRLTLEKLSFKDEDKLKAMKARYGEVIGEVRQAEHEIALRRADTINKYIERDKGRFPNGYQPRPVQEQASVEAEESKSETSPVFKLSDVSTPSFKYAYPEERKYSATSVRLMIAPARAKLSQSVRIQVVENQDDIPISAERLREGKIVGAYDGESDTVYIVARAIGKREDALSTLAHELVHRGLNGILTVEEGKAIFRDIFHAYKDTDLGRQILESYGIDVSTMEGKWRFSHELIAHMAETGEHASLFKRIVGMIKAALRKMGISLNYTDADIVHIINKALAYEGRPDAKQGASYKLDLNTDRAAHPELAYHDSRPFKERLKESLGNDINPFTKYFYNPFFKGEKIPEWKRAIDISENRRETRNEANHRYFSTIKDFFSLQGDSLHRVEKVLIEGDATLPYIHADLLKEAVILAKGGNTEAANRLRAKAKEIQTLNRYSDEELREGLKLANGETVTLNPKEIETYKTVRDMFDTIHEDWYRNQMNLLLKPYRNQPWHTPFQNIFDGRDGNPEMKALWKTLQRFTDDKYRGKKEETKQRKRDADAEGLKNYIADTSGITDSEKIDQAFKGMVDVFRTIRTDANAIRKARNRMGQWIGYFPRTRGQGKYFLNVYEVSENENGEKTRTLVYNTAFNSVAEGEKKEREIIADSRDRNIETELGKVTRESEQSFVGATDTNLQRLLDNAIGRVKSTRGVDPDTLKKIKGTMTQAIANELKSRGFGKAAIRRKWALIRGYETTGLQSVVRDYVTGFTGMSTKQEASFDFLDLLKGVDRKSVNLFEDLSKYSKDMLRNQEPMDRISGKARSFAFMWYLGANIRPVLLQITQNYVTGMPFLAEQMRKWGVKGSAEAAYHKAMFDAAKIRIDQKTGEVRGKNLNSWENKLIHEMLAKGIAEDQYVQEITGQMRNRLGKVYDRALKVMSYPFSRLEIFNRESAALAMFRTAWKHFGDVADETERYQKAFDAAKDYVYKTHYAYGKENLPRIASGGDLMSIAARTGLTFRSFTHNYVLSLINSKDWKTIAHSLAYVALFGGLAGLPWIKDIFDLIEKWTGYSPMKSARETMRKYGGRTLETMGMHGLPALAGANISGSMAIGIPFIGETPMDTVYGVMGGMVQKGKMGVASLERGDYYRAVENMGPEFIANAMRALRMSEEGKALGLPGVATTQKGKSIFDEAGKPLQLSSWEATLKSMGINPEEYSVQTEAQRVVMGVKEYFQDWHDEIYEGYRIARSNKDQKAVAKTLRDLHEYNQAIRDKGVQLLVQPIKLSNVVHASTTRMTPQQRREAGYKREYVSGALSGT
jgi:N12 class adenine-specific DNA methylase